MQLSAVHVPECLSQRLFSNAHLSALFFEESLEGLRRVSARVALFRSVSVQIPSRRYRDQISILHMLVHWFGGLKIATKPASPSREIDRV